MEERRGERRADGAVSNRERTERSLLRVAERVWRLVILSSSKESCGARGRGALRRRSAASAKRLRAEEVVRGGEER